MNRQTIEAIRDELDHPHGVGCDPAMEERLLWLVRALLEDEDSEVRDWLKRQSERQAHLGPAGQRASE